MLIVYEDLWTTLPMVRLELHYGQLTIATKNNVLVNLLKFVKNHYRFQLKVLTFIGAVDYPEHTYRFQVIYELLTLKFNGWVWFKIFANELTSLESVEKLFAGASWWEAEIWDLFGIYFHKHPYLVKLLTDYGFEGNPLRRDFPLAGFNELKYNISKNRVTYETLELQQEYRSFQYLSPWKLLKKKGKKKRWNKKAN